MRAGSVLPKSLMFLPYLRKFIYGRQAKTLINQNRLSRRHFPASVILPRFSYHCKLSFSLPLAGALSRGWLSIDRRLGTPLLGYLTLVIFSGKSCLYNDVVSYGGYSARWRYLTPHPYVSGCIWRRRVIPPFEKNSRPHLISHVHHTCPFLA